MTMMFIPRDLGGSPPCSANSSPQRSRRSSQISSHHRHQNMMLSPKNSPTYLAQCSMSSSVADEIRNDPELFDDMVTTSAPMDSIALPSSAELTCSFRRTEHRRLSSQTVQSSSSRRASQKGRLLSMKSMENLQKEVDLALEMFEQETFDDHLDCENSFVEGFQPLDKAHGRFLFSDEGDESCPGTASTSIGTTSDYGDYECHSSKVSSQIYREISSGNLSNLFSSAPQTPRSSGGGMRKTKSILGNLPLSLIPSRTTMNSIEETPVKFENAIGEELNLIGMTDEQKKDRGFRVDFESNKSLRESMEPFLAVARLSREKARQYNLEILRTVMDPQSFCPTPAKPDLSLHIASSFGVPYPALRNETPFLYDTDSFPLERILAKTLGVDDLSKLHLEHPSSKDKGRLMAPLQNRSKRREFHRCFDSFVTSHVIPLLHSQALANDVFYTNRHQLRKGRPQKIVYRYQAFPCIRIQRPGECSTGPHCDMAHGHSIGNISFHIPLTSTFGTNALYVESRPGREDWHPLAAKSGPGLGFQFDGARCLHFTLNNETDITRVSLDFRIAITRASLFDDIDYDPDDQLCCPQVLEDEFSRGGPGYYDEVIVNVGDLPKPFLPGPVAMKLPCSVDDLYDPDERVGYPFAP